MSIDAVARDQSPLEDIRRHYACLYTLPQGLSRKVIPGIRLNHTVTGPAIIPIQELSRSQITLLCTDSSTKQTDHNETEPYQVTPHPILLSYHML